MHNNVLLGNKFERFADYASFTSRRFLDIDLIVRKWNQVGKGLSLRLHRDQWYQRARKDKESVAISGLFFSASL